MRHCDGPQVGMRHCDGPQVGMRHCDGPQVGMRHPVYAIGEAIFDAMNSLIVGYPINRAASYK